jgi:hypothetical protein
MIRNLLLACLSVFSFLVAASHAFAQPSSSSSVSGDAQLAGVPAALLDSRAQETERIAALNVVASDDLGLFGRPALVERLRKVMVDKREPADLRLAVFSRVSVLFFSVTHTTMPGKANKASGHAAHAAAAESFNAEVRTLLDDNDVRLQKAAFGWLAIFRDPEAMKRAVDVLQGRGRAALSTLEAISVLTLVDAEPFFVVIHTAYRGTRDIDTREAALRVLGGYAPARRDLTAVARSPQEPARLRRAALETLFSVDREAFPKLAAPLLSEQSESSEEIATLLITLMRMARSQPPYRESKAKGYDDDFDRGVRALLKRNTALRESAHQYLLDTDPTYRSAVTR